MKTPPYAPKSPIISGLTCVENAKNYGPAPKGYRWREVGERHQEGDLCATHGSWYSLLSQGPISDTTYPIATPVKVLVKRDSRGRFAPEVAKKVGLGPKFSAGHGYMTRPDVEYNVEHIGRVLADPVKNCFGLYGCFDWSKTPQGNSYWGNRSHGEHKLSPEDLDYLRAAKEFFEKRIVELTPAPAPSPAVPELQAKILSLETEVADLKRKIASAKVTFHA